MALRAITKLSRNCHCHINNRTHYCLTSNNSSIPLLFHPNRSYHNHEDGNKQGQQNSKWNGIIPIAAGLSTATIIAGLSINSSTDKSTDSKETKSFLDHPCFPCKSVLAEEKDEKKVKEKEATYRRTQTLDKIFDYFATYRYINKKGKNVNLMSVKDFYNAIIPGSSITHGTGLKSEKDYVIITDVDLVSDKLYQSEEIPVPNSILNRIQRQGLLTYTDFCFLMNILATPMRYLDIAFLAFDITADGHVNANEYLKVMTKITKHTGGLGRFDDCGTPEELMRAKYSGLMNFLFGPQRRKKMTKDAFLKFRGQIMDDILWLQFTRYCKDLPDLPHLKFPQSYAIITDVEFCEHLLANTTIPSKKKAQMIKRVTKFFGESSTNPTQLAEGITFDMFRSFYHVLYCGADLERAMYFADLDHGGITKEEFMTLCNWISDVEVDAHMVDVVWLLLDEEGHQILSTDNFAPLMADWRLSRGFPQATTTGAGIIDLKLAIDN